jgi:ribosomal protein S7
MVAGNKKTINRALIITFQLLKMRYAANPLEIVLESLEKIKPVFAVGYVMKSGKRREFPKFLSKQRQLQLSIL